MTPYQSLTHLEGYKAGADLSANSNLYKAVKIASDGDIELAAADEQAVGILQNQPKSGEICEIRKLGGSLARAGGDITINARLKADANGELVVTTTANDEYIATAIKAAADGDIFPVEITKGRY